MYADKVVTARLLDVDVEDVQDSTNLEAAVKKLYEIATERWPRRRVNFQVFDLYAGRQGKKTLEEVSQALYPERPLSRVRMSQRNSEGERLLKLVVAQDPDLKSWLMESIRVRIP